MQQVWRKRWKHTGWIALGAFTLVLLVSAINRKNNKVCNGIEVSFNEEGNSFFVDEKGVIAILKEVNLIKGMEIKSIDLHALEAKLKSDTWIANAELFFDNKQVLQVIIEEKEPVARIFTPAGTSYYIDSACRKLPLSERLSARVPMFTGFPSDRERLSRPDSALMASVKDLAMFIQADEFWKAQVAQVDITPEGFEMVPTVGSHVVALGKEGNWQQKFDRLYSFYKQVWTKVGFEKYEKIDVQFKGQVVTTIKGSRPVVIDSARARMAYESLLAQVKKAADSIPDATITPRPDTVRTGQVPGLRAAINNGRAEKVLQDKTNILKGQPKKQAAKTSATQLLAVRKPEALKETTKQLVKPQPVKPITTNKQTSEKKVPKAVMRRVT